MEVFKALALDRVQQLRPRTCLVLRMRFLRGVSHFSPVEKSAGLGPHSGSELSADFNPSTLSAHQMAPLDERTSMVDANGHAWVRLDTARGSFWQNLETGDKQWRPPWEH